MVQVQLYPKFATFFVPTKLQEIPNSFGKLPCPAVPSMGGLTDALIEEQAFRQEFEEAVRAEIKHVPWNQAVRTVRGLSMGSLVVGFFVVWDWVRFLTDKKTKNSELVTSWLKIFILQS